MIGVAKHLAAYGDRMNVDMEWLVGISVTVAIGCTGLITGAFWRLITMIRKVDDQSKERADLLHSRLTKVREDTVHKSDLSDLAKRISGDMHEIRDEQRRANDATNLRLDALLNAIANRNNNPKGQ